MIFEDLNITLKIYDIREGEPGNKPSFLQMKADIKLIKEINRKEQLARALNSRSLYANLSFVPTVPRKNTGRSLTTQNSDMTNDYSDDEADPIRVIIAGGDGTVMWGMMELGSSHYHSHTFYKNRLMADFIKPARTTKLQLTMPF